MLRLAPLIVRNVLRNRRRSLLTLASTAISLALLGLLVALFQNMFYGADVSPTQAKRIITRHKVSLTQSLPSSYLRDIENVDGVMPGCVSPYSWFGGKYIDQQHFFARFAVDADTIFNIYDDFQILPDQLAAFKRERTGCALSEKIATAWKPTIKLGDTITITGDIYPVDLQLKVVAIFKNPPNTDVLFFHREYLSELLKASSASNSADNVGTYILLAKSPELVPHISSDIDSKFATHANPTRSESEKEFGRSFLAFLGNIKLYLGAICAAVTFTILLVSANTVAMAVRERTRETAILRTLGYTPAEVLQLILGEAVLISFIGGIFGLGLARLLQAAAEMGPENFFRPAITWQVAVAVVLMGAIVGFFAALVPAMAASRKNVVESLRFTG